MKEKLKILYIDDEAINLIMFGSIFSDDYSVFTAGNAKEGYEILQKEKDIFIIFTDQRMPKKRGVDFFYDIESEYPDITKAIITGYTDDESIENALENKLVKKIFYKPYTENEIINFINDTKREKNIR